MLIDHLYEYLGGDRGPECGVLYSLSRDSSYELLSTPNKWGWVPDKPEMPEPMPGQNLLDAISQMISTARTSVDIATLHGPPPIKDPFTDAILTGLQQAVKAGRRPTVRFLMGGEYELASAKKVVPAPIREIESWLREAFKAKGWSWPSGVPFYMGAIRTERLSWNHAKLIIVDGQEAICGGHNLDGQAYCGWAPVHDVSVRLRGSAVHCGQVFLNLQWTMLSAWLDRTGDKLPFTDFYAARRLLDGEITPSALASILHDPVPGPGSGVVLAVGRPGAGLACVDRNPSVLARNEAIRKASHTIRLSQQMLSWSFFWDPDFLLALTEAVMTRGVNLYVIMSEAGASDPKGDDFSSLSIEDTAFHLWTKAQELHPKLTRDDLISILSARVHIAPVRFSDRQPGDPAEQSWKWRHFGERDAPVEPANHAKVYIVDDEIFYVGSDNVYPCGPDKLNSRGLQEFGYIFSGKEETARFLDEYWNVFWTYAGPAQFTDWRRFPR